MQWSGGWNAGFSTADPEQLYAPIIQDPVYGYPAVNVESQRESEHSLFHWMRRIIAVRKSSAVFGRGSIEFLYPANHRILAYLRRLGNETVLVVNNLSSAAQAVELDLRRYKGNVLIEMFGNNLFPRVGDLPYLLTLSAYGFYWFKLTKDAEAPAWHEQITSIDGWHCSRKRRASSVRRLLRSGSSSGRVA